MDTDTTLVTNKIRLLESYTKSPNSSYVFSCHTKTTTEITIWQQISHYKPIMEGSEHSVEISFVFMVEVLNFCERLIDIICGRTVMLGMCQCKSLLFSNSLKLIF